ncbi:hypothetical protein JCM19240_5453 [Vibrio maritimus]|uniref:Uncharacterized protein n=1 Tax=Vibrio maritimus TaxID=990268 RepID=A0A090TL51_9VIBR|nr:hypothetical protein JCM19240_5453 [Vibrio maritimus]
MAFFNYVANYFQSTYKYETNDTWLAKLFYLSPAERAARLNELFDTDAFWGLEIDKDSDIQGK